MSLNDPPPPLDLPSAVEKYCMERGEVVEISPSYYQWFAAMGDEVMTALIRLLVRNRADDINHLVFKRGGNEADMLNMVHTWLRLVARCYIQFGPDESLVFFKPVGPAPTNEEVENIQARIASTDALIKPVIVDVLGDMKKEL